MATTTTNFGWDIPQSTDLVKDGATAIAALGQDIDTALVDLKGGTTGQILAKASNTDLDYSWITNDVGDITAVTAGTGISGGGTSGAVTVTNSMATAIDAKGDLIGGTGADTFARLAVGANGTVLTADSAEATGLKWATPATTGVGLTLINTTSFSGVSSVSLANNSFTSTYTNYKLLINISTYTNATNNYLAARLRASGTDNSTSNYTSGFFVIPQTSSATNDVGAFNENTFNRFGYLYTSQAHSMNVDFYNPQASLKTSYTGTVSGMAQEQWLNSGYFNATTSFDSFTFYPAAGTITGSYSLYGYNK